MLMKPAGVDIIKTESAATRSVPPPAKHHSRWRTGIRILQGSLLIPLAVVALESCFNLAGIGQGEIVKPDTKLGCRHINDKFVTWRLEGFSRGRLNKSGMRDVNHTLHKSAGVTRLAFLGDSYTEGLQVPQEDIFAKRIETTLNDNGTRSGKQFESLNFGCSSYSTGQELLQFESEIKPYNPDIVILLFTPGDTLENSVAPAKRASAEARPYFYFDNKKQLQEDDGLLRYNKEKLKERPLREFLRANSTIFGVYEETKLSLSMSDKVFFRTTRLIEQTATRIGAWLARLRGAQAATAGNAASTPGLLPPTWQEPDQVAISTALIKRLDDEVKAAGGKLVVVAFPDVSGGNLAYGDQRVQISKLAQKQGFGYLDLSIPFKQDKNPNNLFIQVHFSKLGHKLTAQALCAYLKESGLVTID
ncbi:MAG: SGNH/GDSL hydrolase family protein [Cyanobacteria bacterium REEB67]|nr:SGNH/GDSL hydrolase family protein [Cyanobacteria bacterium REEB67]